MYVSIFKCLYFYCTFCNYFCIFRGKEIKMVNSVMNRVEKFGEGVYKYNSRGFVVQNAREEKFQYSTRGFLVTIK